MIDNLENNNNNHSNNEWVIFWLESLYKMDSVVPFHELPEAVQNLDIPVNEEKVQEKQEVVEQEYSEDAYYYLEGFGKHKDFWKEFELYNMRVDMFWGLFIKTLEYIYKQESVLPLHEIPEEVRNMDFPLEQEEIVAPIKYITVRNHPDNIGFVSTDKLMFLAAQLSAEIENEENEEEVDIDEEDEEELNAELDDYESESDSEESSDDEEEEDYTYQQIINKSIDPIKHNDNIQKDVNSRLTKFRSRVNRLSEEIDSLLENIKPIEDTPAKENKEEVDKNKKPENIYQDPEFVDFVRFLLGEDITAEQIMQIVEEEERLESEEALEYDEPTGFDDEFFYFDEEVPDFTEDVDFDTEVPDLVEDVDFDTEVPDLVEDVDFDTEVPDLVEDVDFDTEVPDDFFVDED